MYLCYIDESGTPELGANTSHFVLCGVSIPIANWRDADNQITAVLKKYDLGDAELHTAWLLRAYSEQDKITGFDALSRTARRSAVSQARRAELLRLQRASKARPYRQAKKNFKHTDSYIHLTRSERLSVIRDVADAIGSWKFATIFSECIDKLHFDPARTKQSVDEQAFEQVVSRFEQYLTRQSSGLQFGLLVHDNNQTTAKKHTDLMRRFHNGGTLYTTINHTIETPLFVDSSLTRMVQIADLCSYSLRRFCENQETDLFQRILPRVHIVGNKAVGVRHFAGLSCVCEICDAHHRGKWKIPQPAPTP